MQVNIESPSNLRRKMTIELEADEIRRELDRSYNELKRGVHMKGFRPGKAPRQILERFFGDQVRGEVIQKLIKDSTDKALKEHDLKPVAEPEIVTEETDLAKILRFSATFDLKPEIVVKDYVALKVPRATVEVSEQEVDEAMERIRQRMATLKKVDTRTQVRDGDVVIADLQGFDDGKPVAGTKAEALRLEVSEQTLAHGLHEAVVGAEIGRTKSTQKAYPAEYQEKDLAGKTIEWRVDVKEIFEKQLPALDDEFAKDHGEFQTLAELREKVRGELLEGAKQEARRRARQGLLEIVLERNPIEVPQSLVERELSTLEAQAAILNQARGIPSEQAAESAHAARDEMRPQAEKLARTQLILGAIADQEKVEISDDELAEEIGRLVRNQRRRESAAEYYAKDENREALRDSMRRERAMELVMERAQSDESGGESPSKAVVDSAPET